jgi:hypothetical protein
MEVHFTPELEAKLNRVAADIQSGPDEYVQQLVTLSRSRPLVPAEGNG